MDLGVPQRLAAADAAAQLNAQGNKAANPDGARKAAQQFGALMMQNLMRQSDGSALPMAAGTGSDVVNQMFAGTISRAMMAHEKTGLTDLILHSIQKKQQQAGESGTEASGGAAKSPATGTSFPLAAYWQSGGLRPFAAAIAAGVVSPGTGAALAMMTHMNPKLTATLSAGANSTTTTGNTTFQSSSGHAAGGASAEQIAAFAQKLMPLLEKAGDQLGVSPRILLAQAAIETGWGRSVVGNNLFGIKAGSSWTGAKVDAATHEYQNGELISITDAFRAYPSAEASVQDFVSLVANSSRYRAARGSGEDAVAYAQGLLAGGWATDINYVQKLQSVASNSAAKAAVSASRQIEAPPSSGPASVGQPISLLPVNFAVNPR